MSPDCSESEASPSERERFSGGPSPDPPRFISERGDAVPFRPPVTAFPNCRLESIKRANLESGYGCAMENKQKNGH